MTRTARVAFAVLVCATFGAFFAAQELKTRPPEVQDIGRLSEYFSPNRDGRLDRARLSFTLKQTDEVTATVIDREGDTIATLRDDEPLRAGRRMQLVWDGTDGRNRTVPDGTYRVRLNLRRQGRAVLIPRNLIKDTTPPRIVVDSVGPLKSLGPELLPHAGDGPAEVNFSAPGHRKEVLVYRTDVSPARAVFDQPVKLADDAKRWTWNGTVDGRRVAAGTYVAIVRARDAAGNVGSSVAIPPAPQYGRPFRGRGGITVRYLRAQGPSGPVTAGETAQVAVEAAGARFAWRLRRVGGTTARRGSGTRTRVVRFKVRDGKSGLFLFEVNTSTRRTATPVVVQSKTKEPVLVVLPVTTWQGLNGADDDGDGRPDTLTDGLPVRLARPYVKDGVAPQIRRHEALLLAQLDRQGRRYDLTTDVALARGDGPQLAGHRGVILAGDARWLDDRVARALRSYVRGGGRLLSLGTRSLQRSVTQTPGLRATKPTQPTPRDLFGFRLRALERPPAPVTLVNVVDKIDLFAGTDGQFAGVDAFEETLDVRGGSDAVEAAAATQDGERSVIVAARVGKGLVIRTGLPDFSAHLRDRPQLAALLDRIWTLLRRR